MPEQAPMMAKTTSRAVHNLGAVDQIPLGEGRTFYVGDATVAVFRTRTGQVYATQATCPHKGGPLADGIVGAGKVVCPLHAFQFELASGRPLSAECAPLQTYQVHVNEQDIVELVMP